MGIRSISFSGDFDSLSLDESLSSCIHEGPQTSGPVQFGRRPSCPSVGQDMSAGVRAGVHVHLLGRLR